MLFASVVLALPSLIICYSQKAKRSYQKDLAAFRDTRDSKALAFEACRKIPENAKSASTSNNGNSWFLFLTFLFNQ